MCDYCDCRSHAQLASLSEDHERLLVLLTELERAARAGDRTDAAATVDDLAELLGQHADTEERGVLMQLRLADAPETYVARFESEHRAIDALLTASRAGSWREAAVQLVVLLRRHIAREESDLFPAAHQLLAPEQWDAIDALVLA